MDEYAVGRRGTDRQILLQLFAVSEARRGRRDLALITVQLKHMVLERQVVDGQVVLACVHLQSSRQKP